MFKFDSSLSSEITDTTSIKLINIMFHDLHSSTSMPAVNIRKCDIRMSCNFLSSLGFGRKPKPAQIHY